MICICDLPAGLALLQEIYFVTTKVVSKNIPTPATCVNQDRRYCKILANGQLSVLTGISTSSMAWPAMTAV